MTLSKMCWPTCASTADKGSSSLEVSEVRSLLCHPLHVFAHHLSLPMRNSSETTAFMSSSCFYFFVDTPPSWTNIQHIFSALEFDTWKSHESCSERLRGDTDCRDLIFNQKLCFPCKAVLQWHMEDSKMTQHFQTWTRPLLQKGSICQQARKNNFIFSFDWVFWTGYLFKKK